MEPVTVGYISVIALVVMGVLGFVGIVILVGWDAGLTTLKTVPYSTWANFDFSVVPLFILMGEFCFYGKISDDLFNTANKFLGSLKGGLAMAAVGACAAFAAVSGSSVATAATMGTVVLPEMKKYSYDPALATGSLAAGGTIGILIPPSVIMVIYGMITEQSIGKLFLAGFIPGILQALLFIALIAIMCWRNPLLAPAGKPTPWIEKIKSLKNTWIVLVLFLLVIGGINMGWFSPTEGAGIGAIGAFFFALARRKLGWKSFGGALLSTVKNASMIFFITCGAMILGYFFAVSRLPNEIAAVIAGLEVSRYIIWAAVIILYLFLGCILDSVAMVLLTVPILFPLMCGPGGLGFDPIWFGIMIVIVVEMGLITPPVGMNVFVIKGLAQDVPTYTIFRGIVPFLLVDVAEIILLTVIPGVVLFLPNVLG
jgi:tripartite ATP-independent transporter DctM subunit